MWSKQFACVFILATVSVYATGYFESDVNTTWGNVTCNLAEPRLTYNNGVFMVNETLPNINDVWIGYIYAKVSFLLLGCATGRNLNAHAVATIGDCFSICGPGNFGIQPKIQEENNNFISCICYPGSVNTVERNCITNGQGQSLCSNGCYEIYTKMNVYEATASIKVVEGDCLTYFYPSFAWLPCNITPMYPNIMCSNGTYTGDFTRFSLDSYAYVNRSSNNLRFAKNGEIKRALCQTVIASTTEPSEVSEHTTYSFLSTEVNPISTPENSVTSVSGTNVSIPNVSTADGPTKAPSIGVGTGVSVGIMFLISGAIVLIVLKRRGMIPCGGKTQDNKPSADKPVFEDNKTYGKCLDENMPNHNYFILEKCEQSINDHVEHYNETNEADMEDDYNTIQEPYTDVNEDNHDYDYTVNALRSRSDARKLDNVYNKLKVARPGDSDQVGIHGHNGAQVSVNDYDTTSAVVFHGKDDISDYNHISYLASNGLARDTDIKVVNGDEYDAAYGMKFKVGQSDASDYAYVNKDRMQ
ncbi:uncharacterized protein LOC127861224 isoform X2 [Dreissena polymorpha]|uniref:uncharacterized protein LOC127861224 isoform X2 n=1 Tax=Dreissena polymorpha TaxID=45954 RepID=UPI002263C2E5|nr:uncharacterized protein LOC127861224 isoform X2 [Dreissena polymorpha]